MDHHVSEQVSPRPIDPLIESDSIEGTNVFGRHREICGFIKRLVIEKSSGQVVYAVMQFRTHFGLMKHFYPVPWRDLKYHAELDGFVIDLDEHSLTHKSIEALHDHPAWKDREREKMLHTRYDLPVNFMFGGPY